MATAERSKRPKHDKPVKANWRRIGLVGLVYSAWLMIALFGTTLAVGGLITVLVHYFNFSLAGYSQNLVTVGLNVLVYSLVLAATIGLPRWILYKTTTWAELGLQRSMTWLDIALSLAGMVTYFILTMVLISLAAELLPWFDLEQVQETGIVAPQRGLELTLVFVLLVVMAPVVEELLFRGYLYGKLRFNGLPFWLTAIVVSALFGFAHGQWNVGVDTFALSLVMCAAREISGSVWPAILMHMMKNSIAYYFLFINPDIIQQLSP